jgi:hypothetical protein
MTISLGDTLHFKVLRGHYDAHLHVVISDPRKDTNGIVVVNLTSVKPGKLVYQDSSCILQSGDHPFIKRPTWIRYADAKEFSILELDKWLATGELTKNKPMPTTALKKIIAGAGFSVHFKNKFKTRLIQHGLIVISN